MSEIIAALDEKGANKLIDDYIASMAPIVKTGSGNLGPFVADYTITATLTNGDVDLIPSDTIRIVDVQLNWSLDLSFGLDLSSILPDFCLPQVCIDIPCVGTVCTPELCVDWPTITIPVSFSDYLKATVDFQLAISLDSGQWKVEAVVLSVPELQFGPTSAALLAAITAAVTPILLMVPFIGPFLAVAVDIIIAAIAIAGVTGFLGPIITPFISGLRIELYSQPQVFEVLPAASAVDPKVDIVIDAVKAEVQHNGTEDELVLTADISA